MCNELDEHIFSEFDNGQETKRVEWQLFRLDPIAMRDDYEDEMLVLTQEIVDLSGRRAFIEGVAAYIGVCDSSDTEALLQEVRRRYAEKGIELKKAVVGWFRKNNISPSTDQSYRRNLYDFCFAMGMDYETTAKFFLKSFMTIPFNYKDRVDAVYFYCLKEKRPYAVVEQMLEVAEAIEASNQEKEATGKIGKQIFDIKTDGEFIEYLQHHCYERRHQYTTAKQKVAKLIIENKKIVPGQSKEKRDIFFDDLGTKKNSALLRSILGYTYQNLDEKQLKRMKESGLPVFPRDGDVDKAISEGNEISFEVLRKLLILMKFYNFYRKRQLSTKKLSMDENEINENLYDFFDGTNAELAKCGFVQLYPRNPYDWIILFCANSANPIDCLREFIDKRYKVDEED